MSDVDDELLLLAGGDISDADEQSSASRYGSESPARPSKKSPSPKGGRKTTRDADESEEEGEASPPGSPDSQGSAAMDESDSDDDSPQQTKSGRGAPSGDDDLNKYPVDGLFVSHAEKAEIMSMREIEKEQKIAERREEIERIRQNIMLRQLVDNNQQDTRKRKAAAADIDDRPSKTSRNSRPSRGDEPPSKIDSLRKAREERKDRIQQRERESERDRNKRRSPSYGRRSASRDSRDDGSDVEWADDKKRRSRTPEKKETPEAELRDVERIRVGRSRFAEVCFYPGFEEAITGCYVRVNIGPDRDNLAAGDIYRMAIIKGFAKGKAYAMPNRQGKQIVVDTYVKAAHGKAQREWPFIACSDSPFTEAEFNRYKSVCASESVPIAKRPAFIKKIDDINGLVNRRWTETELAEKLSKQNALKIKYSGMQRERVQKLLDEALARGDSDRAAKLQEELDGMETHRLAFRTSLTPAKSGTGGTPNKKDGPSQQERLALLNLENRRKNAEAVRQAQLKERAKARETERKAMAAAAAASQQNSQNGGVDSPDKAPVPATDAELAERLRRIQQEREERNGRKGVPTIHKPLMDDDIIGALDLGIDVDIEL
ncbi:plus-3 domain-containing protein [Coniochaeta sp. 2T2.1]|nr:plus-3 domain-containing protein [Coniochaeta sp. 2T2.1]